MDTRQLMENFEHLSLSARLLTCYDDVLQKPAGQALQRLLDAMAENDPDQPEMILAYQAFVRALAEVEPGLSLPNYILKEILASDNAFSNSREPLDAALSGAILNDLETLQRLARLSSEVVRDEIRRRYIVNARDVYLNLVGQLLLYSEECSEEELPTAAAPAPRPAWRQMYRSLKYCLEEGKILTALPRLSEFYRHYGAGIWNKYQFLSFDARSQKLEPRAGFREVHPEKILDPDATLQTLFEAVAGWLKGQGNGAEPILLRGPGGSGKSTAIAALATYFAKDELLVVDLPGEDAGQLPRVIEALRGCPQKTLIVCDDLRLSPDDALILARVLDVASEARHPESWLFLGTLRTDEEGLSPLDADDLSYRAFMERFGRQLRLPALDENQYFELARRLTSGHGFHWSDEFREAFVNDVARGGNFNYRRMNRTLSETMDKLSARENQRGEDLDTPFPK